VRRQVESNHDPQSGTNRLSIDDQNRLILTSIPPQFYFIAIKNKNNISIYKDVVFGSPLTDMWHRLITSYSIAKILAVSSFFV